MDHSLFLNELSRVLKSKGYTIKVVENAPDKIADILDREQRNIGHIDSDCFLSANNQNFDFLKEVVSKVREYTTCYSNSKHFDEASIKNYRLLLEHNGVVFGGMINENYAQFTTWERSRDGGVEIGHYYDDYEEAKQDFAERSGLNRKPQFSETELKIIFSSLVFSGKTGDLDIDSCNRIERLKHKLIQLVPALNELENEELDMGIEPDYPL